MREIAARYPITYRRVGEKIEALGYDLSTEPPPKRDAHNDVCDSGGNALLT